MPRYYFDVRDGKDFHDDDGTECADLAAVRREALRSAGEMLRDLGALWTGEEWSMIIRDESGKTVSTLKFSAQ